MSLTDLLSAMTWRDALDFGLLLFIVYGLLRVVQGTRAAPVLIGVALFGVLAWVVSALDLIAVASLLRYVFESVIIILIVVFQQELRRALLYLGQRILPAGRRRAALSAVGELTGGLERLRKAHIGALVVLQGEIDVLEALSNKGSEIDAPLHADTLVALAIPHAANLAHDGAIVIQEFRIARAGAICPLSEQRLDPRFGTRHRGAVGMTEETDSLAIVLSEERAEFRLVQAGQISEPLTEQDLEAGIAKWLAEPRAEATRSAGESRADMSRADMTLGEVSQAIDADDSAEDDGAKERPSRPEPIFKAPVVGTPKTAGSTEHPKEVN